MNIDDSFELKIFKCRNVKTPCKAWDAAGWDFFIPENLHLKDFMKSTALYLDDSIVVDNDFHFKCYQIPLRFTISASYDHLDVVLYLAWDFEKNEWKFKVSVNDDEIYEIDDNEIHWIFDDQFVITDIVIMPHASINIPSGIHVNLPENVFLKAENKSGIASKRRLIFLASVVDTDYAGEVHLNLMNVSDFAVRIKAGEKIIQMLPMFQPKMKIAIEFDSLEKLYENKNTERGSGGFGSSGVK